MPNNNKVLLDEVSAFNAQWIDRYIKTEKKGVSPRRKEKLRYTLGKIGNVHIRKRFDQITSNDLEEWVDGLKANELDDPDYPDGYEDSTKVTYLKIAKPFFTWLHQDDDPKFASWIKTGNYSVVVTFEDIFNDEEMAAMRSACESPSDKARFETLYESSARPSEFLSLHRSDVEIEEDCIILHVRKGKNGRPRDIVLMGNARAVLRDLIFNHHPLRNNSDFPLWVDMSSNSRWDPLGSRGLNDFVKRLREDASEKCVSLKRKKRVYSYMLRHTRLTDLARGGMNEAMLREIAGWSPDSRMASVYVHLAGRDQKPALRKFYGLEEQKIAKPSIILPKTCFNCQELNPADNKVCLRCKYPLDVMTSVQMLKKKMASNRTLESRVDDLSRSYKSLEKLILERLDIDGIPFEDYEKWQDSDVEYQRLVRSKSKGSP